MAWNEATSVIHFRSGKAPREEIYDRTPADAPWPGVNMLTPDVRNIW